MQHLYPVWIIVTTTSTGDCIVLVSTYVSPCFPSDMWTTGHAFINLNIIRIIRMPSVWKKNIWIYASWWQRSLNSFQQVKLMYFRMRKGELQSELLSTKQRLQLFSSLMLISPKIQKQGLYWWTKPIPVGISWYHIYAHRHPSSKELRPQFFLLYTKKKNSLGMCIARSSTDMYNQHSQWTTLIGTAAQS